MALWEDVSVGSVVSSSLIGIGLVIAAPLLLPAVDSLVAPLVREVFKGGVRLFDRCPCRHHHGRTAPVIWWRKRGPTIHGGEFGDSRAR